MSSQITSRSRADNSADLLRVLVALGLLALLASFDGNDDAAAATAQASAGVATSQAQ
jgi:hypothetical protein